MIMDFSSALNYSITCNQNFLCFVKDEQEIKDVINSLSLRENEILVRKYGDTHQVDQNWQKSYDLHVVLVESFFFKVELSVDEQISLYREIRNKQEKIVYVILCRQGQWHNRSISSLLRNSFWIYTGFNHSSNLELIRSQDQNIDNVFISPELQRYIRDIIVHLRVHRLTDKLSSGSGGILSNCYQQLTLLSKCIAKFNHKRVYVIPQDVKDCCLLHLPTQLIVLNSENHDITTAYGSNPQLSKQFIETLFASSESQGPTKPNDSTVENIPFTVELMVVNDVLRKIVPAM